MGVIRVQTSRVHHRALASTLPVALAAMLALFSATPSVAQVHVCTTVSAGAETSGVGTIQNVGQSAIGWSGGSGILMHAGALACLQAKGGPQIVTAVSRKVHGGAGHFDHPVSAYGAVEPRTGPVVFLVTFSKPFTAVGGLDASDVAVSDGTVSNVSALGNVLTIELAGVSDPTPLYVTFPGLRDAQGNLVTDSLCVALIAGDVLPSYSVNIFDLLSVRSVLSQATTPANYLRDVQPTGGVNIFDLLQVRSKLSNTVSAACP